MSISKIKQAIAQFKFTATQDGEQVRVFDAKNRLAALVENGQVVAKYQGAKVLCGSLVRNAIREALAA